MAFQYFAVICVVLQGAIAASADRYKWIGANSQGHVRLSAQVGAVPLHCTQTSAYLSGFIFSSFFSI